MCVHLKCILVTDSGGWEAREHGSKAAFCEDLRCVQSRAEGRGHWVHGKRQSEEVPHLVISDVKTTYSFEKDITAPSMT